MRPHRSSCQDASSGNEYSVRVDPDEVDVNWPLTSWTRDLVTDGVVVSVGNNWARASLTNARAERKLAKASEMFWLERATCSSSAFNCGSLNISHHFPRIAASIGCAGFQVLVALLFSGTSSLNAGGVCAEGL